MDRSHVTYTSNAVTSQENKMFSGYDVGCLAVLFSTDKSLGVKQTPRVSLGNSQPASVMATVIFKPSCKDKALSSEDFFIKIQSLNKLKRSERCNMYIFQKV